jgi:HSP20 family protein
MARNAMTPSRSRPSGVSGFNPLMALNRNINRLFEDFLQPSTLPTDQAVATALITPQINVSETDSQIRVTVELPGVDLKDLEVGVTDDMLVVRGEKRLERSDEDENYHFVERAYGSFQRTVQLPFAADPDQVQASFDNGVLTITIPKSHEQQRTHRIDVHAGARSGQQGGQTSQTGQQASSQGTDQASSQGNGGSKASAQKSESSSSKRGQS